MTVKGQAITLDQALKTVAGLMLGLLIWLANQTWQGQRDQALALARMEEQLAAMIALEAEINQAQNRRLEQLETRVMGRSMP